MCQEQNLELCHPISRGEAQEKTFAEGREGWKVLLFLCSGMAMLPQLCENT
jgi:hypothetical protein